MAILSPGETIQTSAGATKVTITIIDVANKKVRGFGIVTLRGQQNHFEVTNYGGAAAKSKTFHLGNAAAVPFTLNQQSSPVQFDETH